MKTVQDYLNDPRMLNDPHMADALEPVKEIHAIRLMIQDETAGMTQAERTAYFRQGTIDLFARAGLPPPEFVDLSGRGRINYNRTEEPSQTRQNQSAPVLAVSG